MENPPKPPGKNATQAEQDAYAQSLLRMVNLDYQKQQAEKPQVKHMFSKKRLIILAISIVLSIILGWVVSAAVKTPQTPSAQQTIQGIESAGDPKSY